LRAPPFEASAPCDARRSHGLDLGNRGKINVDNDSDDSAGAATSVLLNDGYVEQRPAGTWYRGDTSKMNMIL
jgi:membrane-bound lytic murein transglycosylase B